MVVAGHPNPDRFISTAISHDMLNYLKNLDSIFTEGAMKCQQWRVQRGLVKV
jgi:hypothetical protein